MDYMRFFSQCRALPDWCLQKFGTAKQQILKLLKNALSDIIMQKYYFCFWFLGIVSLTSVLSNNPTNLRLFLY